jgi:hypothetical protein
MLAAINAPALAVPPAERAWPRYREVFMSQRWDPEGDNPLILRWPQWDVSELNNWPDARDRERASAVEWSAFESFVRERDASVRALWEIAAMDRCAVVGQVQIRCFSLQSLPTLQDLLGERGSTNALGIEDPGGREEDGTVIVGKGDRAMRSIRTAPNSVLLSAMRLLCADFRVAFQSKDWDRASRDLAALGGVAAHATELDGGGHTGVIMALSTLQRLTEDSQRAAGVFESEDQRRFLAENLRRAAARVRERTRINEAEAAGVRRSWLEATRLTALFGLEEYFGSSGLALVNETYRHADDGGGPAGWTLRANSWRSPWVSIVQGPRWSDREAWSKIDRDLLEAELVKPAAQRADVATLKQAFSARTGVSDEQRTSSLPYRAMLESQRTLESSLEAAERTARTLEAGE